MANVETREDILPKKDLPPKVDSDLNPANQPARRVTAETRIPMSSRNAKLAVPEIPGWHLHWAIGSKVNRMLKAGYDFVDQSEVDLNNFDLAGDAGTSGNTDLGSRVSVAAGADVDSGRLYLMKLPEEWWNEDCKRMEEANEKIAAGIRGGNIGDEGEDHKKHKYLKEGQKLFIPRDKR